jgi:arylsulfatase B
MGTAWNLEGQYATEVFTDEALRIIQQHDEYRPLFLYLSHLAVHAGNAGKLLEAPQEVINRFRHIKEPNRRTYAGKFSVADQKSNFLSKIIFSLLSLF